VIVTAGDRQYWQNVWILGAGFSRALGGPLISDLLALRDDALLKALYPHADAELIRKAQIFFRHGKLQGYWEHAEQFLDIVELASLEEPTDKASHAHTLLQTMIKGIHYPEQVESFNGQRIMHQPGPTHVFPSLKSLATSCRKALVAECSVFLRSSQPDSERWAPYVTWAEQLSNKDAIVTFNYDLVPEILAKHTGKLRVMNPMTIKDELSTVDSRNVAPALKLHGSVCWSDHDTGFTMDNDPERALSLDDDHVVLGIPGPRKRTMCAGKLKRLWKTARYAVKNARRIIFIGFRFPPTDTDARCDFLAAISSNSDLQAVDVVLGPNIAHPDVVRLKELLSFALRRRPSGVSEASIRLQPLWAEDYLSLIGLAESPED
jgi:hypothetical protein